MLERVSIIQGMTPSEKLNKLYSMEINVRIESFWDSGWTVFLGDEMNGFVFKRGEIPTFNEAVDALWDEAVKRGYCHA